MHIEVLKVISILVISLVIMFLTHSVIPTYYNKIYNKKIIKNTDENMKIMLTFDDGPDPRYTNDLLDVLKKNQIKAIFFVVARNAERNPDIIKRMKDEGHEIALHSLEHKNAWLYSRLYMKKDFYESLEIMNKLGVDVKFYRPPWGHTNMFTMGFADKLGLKVFLWDVMAEDWDKETSAELIIEKIEKRTLPNSIICLHDAGENSGGASGAPRKTIEALKIAIPNLKASGFSFITPERSR